MLGMELFRNLHQFSNDVAALLAIILIGQLVMVEAS